jgi:multisubunit Na+/H+ antiporter MnhB subunit
MAAAVLASRGGVRIRTLSPLVILSIFTYGYLHALGGLADPDLSNQLLLSIAVLFLFYLVDWYAVDLETLIKIAGLSLCAFTVFAVSTFALMPNSALSAYFTDYFLDYSLGAASERSFSDSKVFSFRIGSVAFLYLPFCLFFDSLLRRKRLRDLLAVLLIVIVAVISTSRALILGSLLSAMYLMSSRMPPSRQLVALCFGALLSVGLVMYVTAGTTIFSLDEQSNSVKVGHAVSFFDQMTSWRMLFGDGLASTYYTLGFQIRAAQTEVTLLDMIRYFGLPLTVVLYASLLLPSLRHLSVDEGKLKAIVIFVVYLLMALTNPILFNSFGLVVVVWYWSRMLETPVGLGGR